MSKTPCAVNPTLHRRTFEAAQHPAGSVARARLNCDPLTSEYARSHRYLVRREARMSDGSPNPVQAYHDMTYRTKAEAEAAIGS